MLINCIVLASGNSTRFGSNKLLTKYKGKPMIEHVLASIPEHLFHSVIVVTKYPEIITLSQEHSYQYIFNHHSELGQSYSIRLGIQSSNYADAILFQVGDQPNIHPETYEKLVSSYLAEPDCIHAVISQGQRGNPCIFPKLLFDELLLVEGDKGGNVVIKKHPDLLRYVECLPEELMDIDTKEELER